MPEFACFKITGEVQGVGMRFLISRYAQDNGFKGWVKNASDGSVECCLNCINKEIDEFTSWLKLNFDIQNITAEQIKIDTEFDQFEIKY